MRYVLRESDNAANAERDAAFNKLADDQRGRPEHAMLLIQQSVTANEYGWVCEHVGDLTHRMAERFSSFQGQYGIMQDKVEKTLRTIKHQGFEREIDRQIASEIRLALELGKPRYKNAQEARETLEKLGRQYAAEHAKLRVYNKMQMYARGAAVALGEMNFPRCINFLEALKSVLDCGEAAWVAKAGEYNPRFE